MHTAITAAFRYKKNQVIQALRYHFISKAEMRIMIILVNVFAVFALALYIWGKINATAFLINALLWFTLMISLWFVLPYAVYAKSQTFKNKFTMVFDDQDFVLIHEHGRRSWRYNVLHSVKETPHFFHLYFDPRSFILVPKDGFKTDEDVITLRRLLRARVGA